jgi:hypothetical protein
MVQIQMDLDPPILTEIYFDQSETFRDEERGAEAGNTNRIQKDFQFLSLFKF